MSNNILEILAQKRERIALLHSKLGDWLSHYNRLYQKAEDFLKENSAILSTENGLLEETKKIFAELENDNFSLNQLVEVEILNAYKSGSGNGNASESFQKDEDQTTQITQTEIQLAESVQIESRRIESEIISSSVWKEKQELTGNSNENSNRNSNGKNDGIFPLSADAETSFVLYLDLEGLALSQAVFKFLETVFPKPQLINTICQQLLRNGFKTESMKFYEQVRSVLRRNLEKGVFEKVGVEWKVADKFHGKVFPYPLQKSKSKVDKIEAKSTKNIKEISEIKDKSVEPDILFVENFQFADEVAEEAKTLTECYREIIEQSGQNWLHIDQILVLLKNNYNIVRKKSNVASVLRQGAKNNRTFKFYGKNRFGLLEEAIQKKSVTV